jgi:hypothetical protein
MTDVVWLWLFYQEVLGLIHCFFSLQFITFGYVGTWHLDSCRIDGQYDLECLQLWQYSALGLVSHSWASLPLCCLALPLCSLSIYYPGTLSQYSCPQTRVPDSALVQVQVWKKLKTLLLLHLPHSLCTKSPTHKYSNFVCIQGQNLCFKGHWCFVSVQEGVHHTYLSRCLSAPSQSTTLVL